MDPQTPIEDLLSEQKPLALGCLRKMGRKKEIQQCRTSVTIIGFVGADPEQRQARNNNGSKFTVLSVATQQSWKNTDDEWASTNGIASALYEI